MLHAVDEDFLMAVANRAILSQGALGQTLAGIAKAVAELKGASLPGEVAQAIAGVSISDEARAIAKSLAGSDKSAVFLGSYAQHHPQFTTLHVLAQEIARMAGGKLGFFAESANSVGAAAVGAEPGANGRCAQGMVKNPRKAYLTLNVEPHGDCADPAATLAALRHADFVVSLAMFKSDPANDFAQVLLPIAPFTETAGTFVNMAGLCQSFNGVVKPLGEARPAWKVLRVLGNMLGLDGFDQDNIEAVRADIAADLPAFVAGKLGNAIGGVKIDVSDLTGGDVVVEVPLYGGDAIVRRAPSLQMTSQAKLARRVPVAAAAE